MPDTVAGNSTTTAIATLGTSLTGTIETNGDHDWYRIDLVAGQTYEFRLHGYGIGQITDTTLAIVGPNGTTQVAYNDDSASWSGSNGLDSRIVFTATTTGTHYLDVAGYNNIRTGDFLLTAVHQAVGGMDFSLDEMAWQLINNYNENPTFGGAGPVAWTVGVDNALTVNITALTAAGQTLARAALQAWTDVTGISFTETSGTAEITFDDNSAITEAYANWNSSGTQITSATVMISTGWLTQFGTGFNSYSFETYIHEIGHALGLGHGGNYNGNATYGVDNFYLNDSVAFSIMSYLNAIGDEFNDPNTFVGADFRYMLTPALADIIAVERLYGGSTATRTGNTTYGYNATTGSAVLNSFATTADAFMTIHDDGGTDTIDLSGYSGAQTLYLDGGTSSNVLGGVYNLSISRGTVIENAIGGSGVDYIHGNSVGNVLHGGGGGDFLYGGFGGADAFYGDADVDTVLYQNFTGSVGAVVYLLAPNLNGGDAAGDTFISIENIQGTALNDRIYMDNGVNVVFGNGGFDTIELYDGADAYNGGGGFDYVLGGGGADTISVGAGDSLVYGEAGADTITATAGSNILNGGADIDTINGGSDQDVIFGGTEGDMLNGNGGADFLFGEAGADIIHGNADGDQIQGNADGDFLYGDAGVDVVLGGDGGDFIDGGAEGDFLFGEAGVDTIHGGAGDEQIYGGSEGDFLYGQAGIDILYGDGGDDTLDGGLGFDTLPGGVNFLIGGAGNDTLYGSASQEQMWGGDGVTGTGNDIFRIGANSGYDIIFDFLAGSGIVDVINLAGNSVASSFAELVSEGRLVQAGANTQILLGAGNNLFLMNVTATNLVADDFAFV